MFVKRLFPNRWAKILAWIGAGVAWGSVAVAADLRDPALAGAEPATPETPSTESATADTTLEALPIAPESGLVIIRYTPVAPPAPEVIVKTVSAPASSGTNQTPTVKSSGS